MYTSPPLDRVANAFLHRQLLERRELLRTCGCEGDLTKIHRAHLAHHRLDTRVIRRDMEDVTAAEARARTPSRSASISGCSESQVRALR
jgi:hypothetical protein